MTTTDIARHASPVALPSRVGQGTAVEQARAVAEVQAAIVVAQQNPRNIQAALNEMRDSCAQMGLAERAFFRYSRGGSQITGASIHLARELARCWGNIQYGITELRRDDVEGQSEMLAFAWDVQTNTRPNTTFIVPHERTGGKKLTDTRDIYENNANNGARRVREQIFAVLPPWFVEEAKSICSKTIADGGGEPLHTRITKVVESFAGAGIAQDRLEAKIGRPASAWLATDVALLRVVWTSLSRGESSVKDEFPTQDAPVDVADIRAQGSRRGRKAAEPAPAQTAPAAPLPVEDPSAADVDPTLDPTWGQGGETR